MVKSSSVFNSSCSIVNNKEDKALFNKETIDAFFEDQSLFESLYVQYEQDPSIRKKRIKAIELFFLNC